METGKRPLSTVARVADRMAHGLVAERDLVQVVLARPLVIVPAAELGPQTVPAVALVIAQAGQEPETVLEVARLGQDLVAELEIVRVAAVPVRRRVLAVRVRSPAAPVQNHRRARLGVRPKIKSVTAALRRDLVPVLRAEDSAVVAETMRGRAAAEAAKAWAAAEPAAVVAVAVDIAVVAVAAVAVVEGN